MKQRQFVKKRKDGSYKLNLSSVEFEVIYKLISNVKMTNNRHGQAVYNMLKRFDRDLDNQLCDGILDLEVVVEQNEPGGIHRAANISTTAIVFITDPQ
jgi:hypothetical protein